VTTTILSLIVACVILAAGPVAFSMYIAHRVGQALPPQGRFVNIGADRIHYVERGSGPPIVFIHGLSGQMRNFAYLQMDDLARSHRVIFIDRPGSGHSTRGASSSATISAQARTIAMFIESLGLDKPLLVGHSLGGAIALAVGLNHPQCVSRLALIAPLTHVTNDTPRVFRGLAIRSTLLRRLVSFTLAIPIAIKSNRAVLEAVFAPDDVPEDFSTRGGGLLGLRPSSFYAASTDLISVQDDLPTMENRYTTLRVPVDVLYGRDDRILDWRHHGDALKRKLQRTTLKLVEGGHMLPVTAPTVTTEWIQALGTVKK
jgi:pimeloyl-ACP methyl ester carboxylesterase